jgi:hypothetical protein
MTSTMTRQEKINEREWAMAKLHEMISPETVIHTRTDYGKGQTDYVRVYIVGTDYKGRPEIQDVTYFVARATEHRMTERGLPFGGGGYSKGLDAFIGTCRAIGQDADQGRWREIH